MRRSWILVAVIGLAVFTTVQAQRAPDLAWPQFRGPAGAGILDSAKLPTAWSATSNVVWRVEVQGRGWSTPFIGTHAQRSELVIIGRQHAAGYALVSARVSRADVRGERQRHPHRV